MRYRNFQETFSHTNQTSSTRVDTENTLDTNKPWNIATFSRSMIRDGIGEYIGTTSERMELFIERARFAQGKFRVVEMDSAVCHVAMTERSVEQLFQ